PPRLEDGLESAAFEVRPQPFIEQRDDADPGDGRIDRKIGSRAATDEQRPARLYAHDLAVALEFPRLHCSAAEASQQACMLEELARVLWPAVPIEVGGCRADREALSTRA